MKHYAGKAIPGEEMRRKTMPWSMLEDVLEGPLYPGTLNVNLNADPELGEPEVELNQYQMWECSVATPEMVKEGKAGYKGWAVRFTDEDLPDSYVEVISPDHLRSVLNKTRWPGFTVEITLK